MAAEMIAEQMERANAAEAEVDQLRGLVDAVRAERDDQARIKEDALRAEQAMYKKLAEVDRLREENEVRGRALSMIARDMAFSAETCRLIAQDVMGGFVDRGEGR